MQFHVKGNFCSVLFLDEVTGRKGSQVTVNKIVFSPLESMVQSGRLDKKEENGHFSKDLGGSFSTRNLNFPENQDHNDARSMVGERLSLYLSEWQEISTSQWVLGVIGEGLKLDFSSPPSSHYVITDI